MKSVMISVFKFGILGVLVVSSSVAIAKKNPPVKPATGMPITSEEAASLRMVVEKVSKKVIKLQGREYTISSATKIINQNGEKVNAKALRKGMSVMIEFNDKQRYVKRQTLSKIIID